MILWQDPITNAYLFWKCPNDSQLYVAGLLYGTVQSVTQSVTPGQASRTYVLASKTLALTTARTIFSITVELMQDNNFF